MPEFSDSGIFLGLIRQIPANSHIYVAIKLQIHAIFVTSTNVFMKAVLTTSIIGALCLVTIVLAAPRPTTIYPKPTLPVCTADTAGWVKVCCRSRQAVKPEPVAPVVHDSANFLVW